MEESGKRVSWVELYLDLIFVLAVGQLAHLIVSDPETVSVWEALGLFVLLWWTWVGFAVLYNRLGADAPAQRLLFLAGSVPTGVAAVALDPTSAGDVTAFVISMALVRLVLAGAHGAHSGADLLRARITRAYTVSALLFLITLAVPPPWRYVIWGIAIAIESGALLDDDRQASRNNRRRRDAHSVQALRAMRPTKPGDALDPHHFAERFGLFLILLLGEVVVEAGQGSANVETTGGWAALVAALIFAAALWWLYFDSAASLNLRVLELSGGSPTVARTIFAIGHMFPSFALLMISAGVGLLLEEDPPHIAYSLVSIGLGIYLLGTRVFMFSTKRVGGAARSLLVVATFFLARLDLEPYAFVWFVTGWAVMCAVLSTRGVRGHEQAQFGFQNDTKFVTRRDGEKVVVQRYRRAQDAEYRIKVMDALREPAAAAGITIPHIREEHLDASPPVVVFEALEGKPVAEAGNFEALARPMGELLARFRTLPAGGLQLDDLWADPDRLEQQAAKWADAAGADPPPLPDPLPAVLAHGDFAPVNILTDGTRITGLLDFESTRLADPYFDPAWWAWTMHFTGELESVWPAFLGGAELDDDPERIEALQILRMLELLAGGHLTPGVRRIVERRLGEMLSGGARRRRRVA